MLDSEIKALRSFETSGSIYAAAQITSHKNGIFCDVCILLVGRVDVNVCFAITSTAQLLSLYQNREGLI